jgi:hypothetical protein
MGDLKPDYIAKSMSFTVDDLSVVYLFSSYPSWRLFGRKIQHRFQMVCVLYFVLLRANSLGTTMNLV